MGKLLILNRSFTRLGTYTSPVSRIRSGRSRRIFRDNLGFIISALTYIAANLIDYLFTVHGVNSDPLREANPIVRGYIHIFGPIHGVLLCKVLICMGVIFAMRVVYLAHKEKMTRLRADYILYGGAILTALGGSLWLFC